MRDTIINGTRTSRSILGNINIPEDWAAARAQLVGEGWPIDLGQLNDAGLSQRGTDLNKSTLLSDETEALYSGLPEDPTVDDAFSLIANMLELIQIQKALVVLTVKSAAGVPMTGALVSGMTAAADGGEAYTDKNGVARGYVSTGSVTLSITGYLDVADMTETFTAEAARVYAKTWTAETVDHTVITATRNGKISSFAESVQVISVGGGYNGESGNYRVGNDAGTYGGKGGDGGGVNKADITNFTPNEVITVTVGAVNGGISSFLEVSSGSSGAAGGARKTYTGPGNNGVSGLYGYGPGGGSGAKAYSEYGFSSYIVYAGGTGGSPDGARGGNVSADPDGTAISTVGNNASVFGGGGGGGGGIAADRSGSSKSGGAGKQGCIDLTFTFKEAA